jgi:hypothetical protein
VLESKLSVAIAFLTLIVAAVAAVFGDDPTPALTLIGALVLALLAAETADTRQQRQIDADADRQTRALEAERERHIATLAHDRELADVADLRGLLDEAAAVLHRADHAAFALAEAHAKEGPDVDADRIQRLATEVYALDALEPRLVVRLGGSSDVTRAFADATTAALNTVQSVRKKADPIEVTTAADALGNAQERVMSAIVELAGARVLSRQNGTDQGTAEPDTR